MFKEGVGQELIQICGLEGLLSSLGEAIVDKPGAARPLPLCEPLPFHCLSLSFTTDHGAGTRFSTQTHNSELRWYD